MRKTRVYIAAPYTNGDVILNVREAIIVGDRLWRAGYIPFVPHLTCFFHLLCPHDYKDWLDYDKEWLDCCDCLLRLSGNSSGADMEKNYMVEKGKPVFSSEQVLCEQMPKEIEL